MFALFFLAACSSGTGNNIGNNNAPSNKTAVGGNGNNAELSEKNKRIALKNEVVRATEAAQTLEKQGRQMESYRLANDAESARQCKAVEADLQRQAKDLEAKMKSFPDPFGASLTSVAPDLHACVSCAKRAAMPACVNARASINKAIKEIFEQ